MDNYANQSLAGMTASPQCDTARVAVQDPYMVPPPMVPTAENKIRTVSIAQLNHGYVVHVGCHQFAFESKETLIEKLSEYINEPADTEKKWFAKELF